MTGFKRGSVKGFLVESTAFLKVTAEPTRDNEIIFWITFPKKSVLDLSYFQSPMNCANLCPGSSIQNELLATELNCKKLNFLGSFVIPFKFYLFHNKTLKV